MLHMIVWSHLSHNVGVDTSSSTEKHIANALYSVVLKMIATVTYYWFKSTTNNNYKLIKT